MIQRIKSLAQINDEARRLLYHELGVVDAIRFFNQFTTGHGDYTRDRDSWQEGLTVEQIVKEIEDRRDRESRDEERSAPALTPKQLRILEFLRSRREWSTRREMEEACGRKGFSKALGAPTAGTPKVGTLEALGYAKRRDRSPPFAYKITETGKKALSIYEREHGTSHVQGRSKSSG
jgi:hypothetical protein